MKQLIRILGALLLAIPSGWSQPLDSLLVLLQENNSELAALQLEVRAAQMIAPQVSQLADPELSLGFFALQPETRVGPQWFRIGATQRFPWSGTLEAKAALASSRVSVLSENQQAVQLSRILEFKQAYLDLYQIRKEQQIVVRSRDIFASLERLAQNRMESGDGSLADVLLVQLRLQALDNEVLILKNREAIPLARINQLLGRAPEELLVIEDSLTLAVSPLNVKSVNEELIIAHPVMRSLRASQDVSRQSLHLNALEGKPSFGVGLDYLMVSRRTDASVPDNGKDVLMPRLAIQIPLYRDKYQYRQREEEIRIDALSLRQEDMDLRLRTNLQEAYSLWQEAELELQLYIRQQSTLDAAMRLLKSGYSAGEYRMDEILRLQTERIDYDRRILVAIVKSHRAVARIESIIPE